MCSSVRAERAGRCCFIRKLRQLYSHARSHVNGSSRLRLPRLLTIPRSSALWLDNHHPRRRFCSKSLRHDPLRSSLSVFTGHDPRPCHYYYYQYARHRRNFRLIESRVRVSQSNSESLYTLPFKSLKAIMEIMIRQNKEFLRIVIQK